MPLKNTVGFGSIRGTEGHPIWSNGRLDWVPLSELKEGESVQVQGGYAKVQRIQETEDIENVYTLEVDADHCYRVGKQGLLVHNASCPCTLPGFPVFDPQKPTSTLLFKKFLDYDGMARPTGVQARLNKNTILMDGSGADPMIFPPGWDERANKTYVKDGKYKTIISRGHLLAEDL